MLKTAQRELKTSVQWVARTLSGNQLPHVQKLTFFPIFKNTCPAPLKKTHPVSFSNMELHRIVQCYVRQASPTIFSDMGFDHSVQSHVGQGCLTNFFNIGLDNMLDPMLNNHCPMSS
jgi:hypothetical protein